MSADHTPDKTANIMSAIDWEYFASIDGTDGDDLSNMSKQILIGDGGGGELWAKVPGEASESQVGEFAAGSVINIQTEHIGASTTATKITVLYND